MATLAKTHIKHKRHESAFNIRYRKFLEEAQFNYFFLISVVILVGSSLGGITIEHVLKNGAVLWQLILTVSVTLASNIAAIGQAPAKWVLRIFGISIVVNIFLIILVNL